MPRRRRHQEVVMPEWVREEALKRERVLERERELVPVPVRREQVEKQYMYATFDEERPWYEQSEPQEKELEWYERLLDRLAKHLADTLYLQGSKINVDQVVGDWLENNREFNRAIVIGLICEQAVRDELDTLDQAFVNSVVNIIFT